MKDKMVGVGNGEEGMQCIRGDHEISESYSLENKIIAANNLTPLPR